jgi:5-methylcytosine-specific restriction enzyme A
MCKERGLIVAAEVADHTIPHHNNPELFYDPENLQSLCAVCHGEKRAKEHGKVYSGCDENGMPLDKDHWWRKEKT